MNGFFFNLKNSLVKVCIHKCIYVTKKIVQLTKLIVTDQKVGNYEIALIFSDNRYRIFSE
jgi:hypothetical protein